MKVFVVEFVIMLKLRCIEKPSNFERIFEHYDGNDLIEIRYIPHT